ISGTHQRGRNLESPILISAWIRDLPSGTCTRAISSAPKPFFAAFDAPLAVNPERYHLILAFMRLLIIEDENRTAAHLKKDLSENGFTVDVAFDGSEGLRLARGGGYSLIVLDVMLPQWDGWAILDELRRSGIMTPVLFVTARDRVEDRVKGLEMGADDYLVKPYAFSDLLARVRKIWRRGWIVKTGVLGIGVLKIATRRHKAVRAGNNLHLTRREFVLLSCLARSAGEVVSRTRIVEE